MNTNRKLGKQRWIVIAAGIAANACMGAGYAFSVFKKDLIGVLHLLPKQVSLAFSLSFVFLPVGMLVCGVIARRWGPRAAVAIGGLIFGLGTLGAGFSRSAILLYLTYGVMVSVGNGITYAAVVATSVRWFPERKGLASGLVVAALGAGTLVIARTGQAMLNQGINVLDSIKILGLCYLTIGLVASRFICDPPKDYAPAASDSPEAKPAAGEDLVWRQMLARPYFWLMFVVYICGVFPGLLLINEAKEVAVDATDLGLMAAAGMVGMLGAANAVGRMAWGAVSDRIGRLNAIPAMIAMSAIVMVLMPGLVASKVGLVIGFLVTGLCFGGCLGTFPSVCADAFGSRNMEINYAILFIAFGASGVLGPWCGQHLFDSTHGYDAGFTAAAAVAAFGLVISIISRFVQPKRMLRRSTFDTLRTQD